MNELTLQVERLPSAIGTLLLLTDEGGRVRSLDFDEDDLPQTHQRLQRQLDASIRLVERRGFSAPAALVVDYLAGDLAALERIDVESFGTPFQCRVWAALRSIPAGETVSYGALAARIGRPTASRAVGMANNANPVPVIVPCHRVIGADGSLTGYGGGLDRKRWLLAHEGHPAAGR